MEKQNEEYSELASFLGELTHDPVKFVYAAFPWGEGELAEAKPQEWQLSVLALIRDGLADISTAIRIAIASGHGIGKAGRMDSLVDTPKGARVWGALRPGDEVFGADGQPTTIKQCKLYRKIPFCRVTFDDDSYCDVSSGHLWNVKGRNDRRTGKGFRTLSTLDIINAGVKRSNGKASARQWEIPIQGAVQYPSRKTTLHPYLMGVWLGDGTRKKAEYTKPQEEIAEKIRSLGYKVSKTQEKKRYISEISRLMTDDVFTKYSSERYIPDVYKYNSVENRKELLCGLLDTDGECNKSHSIQYSTTSKKLAEDILWLVRSLGGKAQLQPTNKQGWYYDNNGNKVICKQCYRITIALSFNPFCIKHRRERYKPNVQHRYMCRWIDKIEYIGEHDGMCISVDRQDGLYLANDFIVTHNSAIVSWLILWAISTHEDTRGVVTANTDTQLRAKTWAELAKWYRLFIAKDLFKLTATSIFSIEEGHEKTWRIDAIPWSKDNPEAFAGLHNQGKRILILFDEASAIIDEIWTVAEGATTDSNTEIIFAAFGNPTRSQGRFFECFNSQAKYWKHKQIDSRNVAISNKQQLNEWVEMYGEDSDFVKVRVRGVFPSQSDSQLISRELAEMARRRELAIRQYDFAPVIIGVDPAWSGDDTLEIVMRQGLYSKCLETIPRNDNDMAVARKIAHWQDEYSASAVFIDMGYGTGIYSGGVDMGRSNWRLVSFAEKSDSKEYANKRAEMWNEMKKWLQDGGSIDRDELITELTAPEAFINRSGKLQLEAKQDMKRRGIASPNKADALALTFAFPVTVSRNIKYRRARKAGRFHKIGTL